MKEKDITCYLLIFGGRQNNQRFYIIKKKIPKKLAVRQT